MVNTLIIQFAKWPRLGQVKTRLAKKLGDQAAYDIHLELTHAVLDNLSSSKEGDVELWFDKLSKYTPDTQTLVEKCQSLSVAIDCQSGKDLGERMYHALSFALKDYQKVIIVGSDCPTVDKAYLGQAVKVLNDHDLVLGPAADGGYVLLGARKVAPTLLDSIAWGQGSVLRSTIEGADKLGLTYGLLESTWDVDEYEDYLRWKR